MNIIYALDTSRDVTKKTLQKMKEFVKGSLHMFDISADDATKVGVVSFDSEAREILPVSIGISTRKIQDALVEIRPGSNERKLDEALRSISPSMFELTPDVKGALVILLNGKDDSTADNEIKNIARNLIQRGVNIYVVAIGDDVNKPQVNALANGKDRNTKYVTNTVELPDTIPSFEEFLGSLAGKIRNYRILVVFLFVNNLVY